MFGNSHVSVEISPASIQPSPRDVARLRNLCKPTLSRKDLRFRGKDLGFRVHNLWGWGFVISDLEFKDLGCGVCSSPLCVYLIIR